MILRFLAALNFVPFFFGQLATADKPIFSFGVIADCQYCNIPVTKDAKRQYPLSREKLAKCVAHLNRLDLEFVVHLGDFIDKDYSSFADVVPIYNRLKADHYHVLGNHDYEVADESKAKVPGVLGLKECYYHFVRKGYRFIVLDGNDVSLHAYPVGDPRFVQAKAYHAKLPKGTPEWNGALGQAQMKWLKKNLIEAERLGERVILFCHFPVYPKNVHNLWNAAEVLDLLQDSQCVIAYMNGHNHAGNYGALGYQHYVTFSGMVDTTETAYGVVNVHKKQIVIRGVGRQRSMILPVGASRD